MAGRIKDKGGVVTIRRIHGLEAMQLIGWPLKAWRHGTPFTSPKVTPELLSNMAGNAWIFAHFLPLAIAAFGCVPWDAVAAARRMAKALPMQMPAEDSGSSSSERSMSD